MPVALVRSYTDAMHAIDARERLSAIHTQQLGGGMLKQSKMRTSIRELEERANTGRRRARPANKSDLAAMGVGFAKEVG